MAKNDDGFWRGFVWGFIGVPLIVAVTGTILGAIVAATGARKIDTTYHD